MRGTANCLHGHASCAQDVSTSARAGELERYQRARLSAGRITAVRSWRLEAQILRAYLRMSRTKAGDRKWHRTQHRLSLLPADAHAVRAEFLSSTMDVSPDICVYSNSVFNYPENITVGARTFIHRQCFVSAIAPITIGSDCLIGPNVVIDSGQHRIDSPDPIRLQGMRSAPIHIGDDLWIGANVSILAGSTVGSGSVIGAGAVVRGEIAPWTVAAGVPAVRIRDRRKFDPPSEPTAS